MEEICNSLCSCELCTGRGCHWLLKTGRCIWQGKGKVANELWECETGTTATTSNPINNNNPVLGNVGRLVQQDDNQNLVLIVTLGIILGLVLLAEIAVGVHFTLRRRLAQRNTCVSHTRLVEAMGYESDTLMSRIRQQLSPRPVPPPPPSQSHTPSAQTPAHLPSSSSSPSPNTTSVLSPSTTTSFSTPSAFSTPAQSDHPSPSTPLLHGQGGHQGTQTRYFDSTPEYPDDLEMVDLTPSPPPAPKGGYNLRGRRH